MIDRYEAAGIALDAESGAAKEIPLKTGETKEAMKDLEVKIYLSIARSDGMEKYVTTTKDAEHFD